MLTDAELGASRAQQNNGLGRSRCETSEDILASGYAGVRQPAPVVMGRDEWVRLLPDYIVHDWQVQERVVAVDGDVATVLMRVAMQATVAGADRSGVFVVTDVWRRANDVWRVWRRHSTPLHAAASPRA